MIASALFGLYVSQFSNYNKTYGSLAGVIIFLLWLWITNLALLFGAELDAEMERGRQLQAGIPAEHELQLPPRDTRVIDKTDAKDARDIEQGRQLRRSRGQHRPHPPTTAPTLTRERDDRRGMDPAVRPRGLAPTGMEAAAVDLNPRIQVSHQVPPLHGGCSNIGAPHPWRGNTADRGVVAPKASGENFPSPRPKTWLGLGSVGYASGVVTRIEHRFRSQRWP